jgi:hypothetical protein
MKTFLAAALAALVAPSLAAQEPAAPGDAAPRVTMKKQGRRIERVVEQDVPITIEVPAKPTKACEATIAIEYEQRNTQAHAEGTIENHQCAASGGSYTMVISIRTASGETKTLEFEESWRRGDDRPVELTRDYPIGPNVDLLRVRPRGLRCACDEAPAQ